MTDVSIDRLALRVTGIDEGAARRLARLVAEGLAPALTAAPPGSVPPRLHLVLSAADDASDAAGPYGDGAGPDDLAPVIVGRITQVLLSGDGGVGQIAPGAGR